MFTVPSARWSSSAISLDDRPAWIRSSNWVCRRVSLVEAARRVAGVAGKAGFAGEHLDQRRGELGHGDRLDDVAKEPPSPDLADVVGSLESAHDAAAIGESALVNLLCKRKAVCAGDVEVQEDPEPVSARESSFSMACAAFEQITGVT